MSLRHQKEHLMVLRDLGTQTAAVKQAIDRLPTAGLGRKWYLKSIRARLGTAGVTGSEDVDIHSGEGAGTTILGGTKIAFATTSLTPTYPALTTPAQAGYAEGTLFQLDVDGIHSGTAAIDLIVELVFSRIPQAGVQGL
jgi:hypothetical protein